jgi:S1-C subfamily serine protease
MRALRLGRRDLVAAGAGTLLAARAKAADTPAAATAQAIVTGTARSKVELIETCVTQVASTMPNGQTSTGSGFIYRFLATAAGGVDSLITNRHVLAQAASVTLYFRVKTAEATPTIKGLRIDDVQKKVVYHPQRWIDIAALPLFDIAAALHEGGIVLDASHLSSANIMTPRALHALSPIEDVLVIGHPQGMADVIHTAPIVRRGITSTPPYERFGAAPVFLLDVRLSHGSSGSPVFLDNIDTSRGSERSPFGNTVVLLGLVSEIIGGGSGDNGAASGLANAVPGGWVFSLMASLVFDLEAAVVAAYHLPPPKGYVARTE